MRIALLSIIALGLAVPALASEKPKEDGNGPVGQYIDLVPMALPVIAKGMIQNYVYMRVRVNLSPGVDSAKAREKEPYLRDALIHAAYKTPFTRADSYLKLDEVRLGAVLAQQSRGFLGPKSVASVVVMSQDPQRVSNVARPG